MAVVPGGSHPRPEGVSDASSLRALQSVTPESMQAEVRAKALAPWQSARASWIENILGGIGRALQQGLQGLPVLGSMGSWFGAVADAGRMVRDRQQDLNGRADLLSPLLDYCSAFAPPIYDGHAWWGPGQIPFTEQLGPSHNCEVYRGGIMLRDKGLWDIRAHIVASWTGIINSTDLIVSVQVVKPGPNFTRDNSDYTVLSVQSAVEKTANVTTMEIVSSVVVDESDLLVMVVAEKVAGGFTDRRRGFYGGPRWCRLTVQHISREVRNHTGGEASAPTPDSTGPE